jgi:DNA-binding NarL/FixJ family response regulator
MANKPNIQIDNEVREMTDEEFDAYKELQAEAQANEAEQTAKTSARESALVKLAALGLTEAEIAAL